MLEFAPDISEQIVSIGIIDDSGRPRIEGKENFSVVIRAPRNARLGKLNNAMITIDDTESDSE